jgi:hypothetical protein
MDYGKIDPALAGALQELDDAEQRTLPVFVRTDGSQDREALSLLQQVGVHGADPVGSVFTGTCSASGVAKLSEQPWVTSVTLAGFSRPLLSV